MNNKPLSPAQANLKLALWNADANSVSSSDLYIRLQQLGLPEEVVTRLHNIISLTKKVGSKVIAVGKIIVLRILEFVKAHPFLVAGAGIGFVVGSAIAALITSIPLVGPLLLPIAAILGVTITAAGLVIGYRLDKAIPGVGDDLVEIAKEFFALFSGVLNAVFGRTAIA